MYSVSIRSDGYSPFARTVQFFGKIGQTLGFFWASRLQKGVKYTKNSELNKIGKLSCDFESVLLL